MNIAPLAVRLAQGGRQRLAALDALTTLVRTDCGRQVGQLVGRGWDAKVATEAYRDWLHGWVDGIVDRFAWRRGEEVKRLYWSAGGARPEPFPEVDGIDAFGSPEDA